MVRHSLSGLLALASSPLLAATTGSSIPDMLEQSVPGFGVLQSFFASWLKIDLTTFAVVLTLFGAVSGALQDLRGVGSKIYWYFIRLFTASISIPSSDRLNREIISWIGSEVLTRQSTRILTARTEQVQKDAWYPRKSLERNDFTLDKRVPIQYLPTFGTTWFIHQRNIFMVRRIAQSNYSSLPDEYASAPEGEEPLVVMSLGRSVIPIKNFLETCRNFAEKQREEYTTVRASKDKYHHETWDTTILRPIRSLETVHFDEKIKSDLVADIINYLDPATRRFYNQRGIPYRRGYLLHGPPGTGKTSLSLALAGYFGLDLYLLHLPSVREDNELEKLFTALPPRCIILVEDIDAVGIKRRPEKAFPEDEMEDDSDDDEDKPGFTISRTTLSGLLNVLDGVASQEGRIVLMTSNFAEKLDKALVRPGRIDSMIYLGHITQQSAEHMFMRMYLPDKKPITILDKGFNINDGELKKQAFDFGRQVTEDTFTPAELQGYLLKHQNRPELAVAEISAWVIDETKKKEEAKLQAKKAREYRIKKRKERAAKRLAKISKQLEGEDEDETQGTSLKEGGTAVEDKNGDDAVEEMADAVKGIGTKVNGVKEVVKAAADETPQEVEEEPTDITKE